MNHSQALTTIRQNIAREQALVLADRPQTADPCDGIRVCVEMRHAAVQSRKVIDAALRNQRAEGLVPQ